MANIQEEGSDFIAQVSEAEMFLSTARDANNGATIIANSASPQGRAITILCGHACELTLKAILLAKGVSLEDLKDKYGHKLDKCWRDVISKGVALPPQNSKWFPQLSEQWKNFELRYPAPVNVSNHPDAQIMATDIAELIVLAEGVVSP